MTHAPEGQPCYCNERGWMPGVEHVPIAWGLPTSIANHEGEMDPAVVVDHIMQGYLNTMVTWTRTGDSKVIVHFGIGSEPAAWSPPGEGRIVQMHSIFTRGIHASAFSHASPHVAARVRARNTSPNQYGIGIEHEGCSVDPRPAYTVPAAMIYGADNPWPEAMVQASIRVHRWCFEQAPTLGEPSRDSIIGHYETGDPNRVNDPAAADDRDVWPRDRIIAALARRTPLTERQRERLVYLDSPAGRAVPASMRARLLAEVGLPSDARLADYSSETTTTPTAPTPPAPSQPSRTAVEAARAAGWQEGYAAAMEYAGGRVGLVRRQVEAVLAETERLAIDPPAAK